MYSSLLKQDIAFYDNAMSGQLNSRLFSDMRSVTTPLPTIVNSVFGSAITIVSGLVICFISSWRLTILSFVFLFPVFYLTNLYQQWASNLQQQVWVHMSEAMGSSSQALLNIRTVRFSG